MLYNLFIKETNNIYIQFFRYIFVAGFAAITNVATLYIFTQMFHIYYLMSSIMSFLCGVIVNFTLSKKLIFTNEMTVNKAYELSIYSIIVVIGILIDTFLVWFFTEKIMLYYVVSKILSTGISFICNFVMRKILYMFIQKR